MATIISTEEITENDLTYIVETYSNGNVIKKIKSDPVTVEETETVTQPTNAEIQENQLVIMDAIATLFETIIEV